MSATREPILLGDHVLMTDERGRPLEGSSVYVVTMLTIANGSPAVKITNLLGSGTITRPTSLVALWVRP